VPAQDWSGSYGFRYGGQRAGAPSYAAAVTQHRFALIVLGFGDSATADAELSADLGRTGGYHLVTQAGRYTVWAGGGGTHAGH
jgi:hypothetical protein